MRIEIMGSVASGKTSLARKLADHYQISHVEKDNVIYQRSQDGSSIRRSPEAYNALYDQLISQADWIVESSPRQMLRQSWPLADAIILMEVPTWLCYLRQIKRSLRQMLGLEAYNWKPRLRDFPLLLSWVKKYPKRLPQLEQDLATYQPKLIRLNHRTKFEDIIGRLEELVD